MSEEKTARWTAKKKTELVLRILKKEVSIADVCRENDLKQSEVQLWIDDFISVGSKSQRRSIMSPIAYFDSGRLYKENSLPVLFMI